MKIGNKRLLKLAKFLKTVPEEKFAMGDWVADVEEILHRGDRGYMTPGCNTTACAIGWATHIWPKYFWIDGKYAIDTPYDDNGEEFFQLKDNDWSHLFCNHQRTPEQEAVSIEKFVHQRIAAETE